MTKHVSQSCAAKDIRRDIFELANRANETLDNHDKLTTLKKWLKANSQDIDADLFHTLLQKTKLVGNATLIHLWINHQTNQDRLKKLSENRRLYEYYPIFLKELAEINEAAIGQPLSQESLERKKKLTAFFQTLPPNETLSSIHSACVTKKIAFEDYVYLAEALPKEVAAFYARDLFKLIDFSKFKKCPSKIDFTKDYLKSLTTKEKVRPFIDVFFEDESLCTADNYHLLLTNIARNLVIELTANKFCETDFCLNTNDLLTVKEFLSDEERQKIFDAWCSHKKDNDLDDFLLFAETNFVVSLSSFDGLILEMQKLEFEDDYCFYIASQLYSEDEEKLRLFLIRINKSRDEYDEFLEDQCIIKHRSSEEEDESENSNISSPSQPLSTNVRNSNAINLSGTHWKVANKTLAN